MNDYSAVSAYQQSTARGATPIGLIVSLYDTILRDFRRALAALDSGNIESRVFELNHALTVIAHLQSVLDYQRGGDAAARLARFYEVTHAMILDASVSGSRESLMKLIDLYNSLRHAWQQADQELTSASARASVAPQAASPAGSNSSVPRGSPATSPASVSTHSYRDGHGRWSA